MTRSEEDLVARCQREIRLLKSASRYRKPRICSPLSNGRCIVDGQSFLNFGGNDYLNLAHSNTGLEGNDQPSGATSSPLVVGRSPSLSALETEVAAFEETEAALVFPSGFAANMGVITGLTEATDAIFCDRDNHASIIDAARASRARLFVYRRDRLDKLAASLQKRRSSYSQILIVTDGVYSMDGQTPKLPELCRIAQRTGATLIVDEAHGTGTLGKYGRGACEHHGVHSVVPIRIGTFSKAAGSLGGFVCGPADVIDWLRHSARTQFFSTALPPTVCETARNAIKTIAKANDLRTKLKELIRTAMTSIKALNLPEPADVVAPIIPIILGDDQQCLKVSERAFAEGCLVPAIRPPTVSGGTSRLRMSLSVAHQPEDVEFALKVIAKAL